MKDDDFEEFLLLENLLFPDEETEEENEKDKDEEKGEEPDNSSAVFVDTDAGQYSRNEFRCDGKNHLSTTALEFIAGLVTAGIILFLILLLFIIGLSGS